MALIQQALDKLELLSFHATAARTATGSATGLDLQAYDGDVVLVLDSAAASAGTNPTLDVTVEASDTLGGTYAAVTGAAFTRVTSTASHQKLVISSDETARFVRVTYTIGGTSSPSFTFSVNGLGVKKYG
jgi:hypothetical protein